jgi:hypothetical protein
MTHRVDIPPRVLRIRRPGDEGRPFASTLHSERNTLWLLLALTVAIVVLAV